MTIKFGLRGSQAASAYALYEDYLKEPGHERFSVKPPDPPPPPPPPPDYKALTPGETPTSSAYSTRDPPLILLCCLLFLWGTFSSPTYQSTKLSTTIAPIYSSPLKKALLYDYPRAYEILATLVSQYGIDAIQNPEQLPPAGQKLFESFTAHPYWQG